MVTVSNHDQGQRFQKNSLNSLHSLRNQAHTKNIHQRTIVFANHQNFSFVILLLSSFFRLVLQIFSLLIQGHEIGLTLTLAIQRRRYFVFVRTTWVLMLCPYKFGFLLSVVGSLSPRWFNFSIPSSSFYQCGEC